MKIKLIIENNGKNFYLCDTETNEKVLGVTIADVTVKVGGKLDYAKAIISDMEIEYR